MNNIVSIILPYYNRIEYIKPTLDSFVYFYKNKNNLQIVIVDDGSNEMNRLDNLIKDYSLWIDLIYIKNKKGINPCYPYNVGVRQSKGDIIVLSSPEIIHTRDIFDTSNNFEKLTNSSYLQFSVFCLTEPNLKAMLLSRVPISNKLHLMSTIIPKFYRDLGINGYSYANDLGAWYTHSGIQPSCFNFLSACTRETYYALNGFNELFVHGTGYDDTEFKDRILDYVHNNVIWYDNFIAIHVDHPTVSNDNNTNCTLYHSHPIYEKNDIWGLL